MALGRNYEQCRHLSIKREKRNNSWKKERCGTIQLALIAAITERSKIDVEANELLFIRQESLKSTYNDPFMRIVQLPEMLSENNVYSVHCSWRDEIVTIVVVDDEGNSTVALPIIEPRSYTREFIMEQEWSIFAPEN